MAKSKKLDLKALVRLVRGVAEAALREGRCFDAGFLAQDDDGDVCVIMTPFDNTAEEEDVATGISTFLRYEQITSYCYMSAMTAGTTHVFVYAASRDGARLGRCFRITGKQLDEEPHESLHRFSDLFPRTMN